MRLRSAVAADAEILARLHAQGFGDTAWSASSLAGLLSSPGAFAIVAEESDIPAGFVLARAAGGEAEILTIAVEPAARRRGLGRALIGAAADKAWNSGASVLFLEVSVANIPARRLYESLGFAEAGRRKAYYAQKDGPAADALTLKIVLPFNLPAAPLHLGNGI